MNHAAAAFHLGLRGIAVAALAELFKMRRLEKRRSLVRRRSENRAVAWDTGPFEKEIIQKKIRERDTPPVRGFACRSSWNE
jgi:hypothetical protein